MRSGRPIGRCTFSLVDPSNARGARAIQEYYPAPRSSPVPSCGVSEGLVTVRASCRICGSRSLAPVFDLGEQYIAGAFMTPADLALPGNAPFRHRYPLELVRCDPAVTGGCGLVQLRHTVARSLLFEHYGYRSGINQTMREHLARIADTAAEIVHASTGDTVLDIGSNDGTLLLSYKTPGLDLLGIDPAEDVTRYARESGIEVVDGFFSAASFSAARPGRKARIVTSIAMFYDLEDPRAFVDEVAQVLAEDGVWVIEVGWLVAMLRMNSFDAVCHEHLEYYGLAQLEALLAPAGLAVQRVETNDINGGSICLFIRRADVARRSPEFTTLDPVRHQERALRLDTDQPFAEFRTNAETIRDELRALLQAEARQGRRTYAYGASTKGNVILQFCALDRGLVQAAADRNPDKWGREMLGSDIPIISEEQARVDRPDYFLALPYHFIDEFKRRELPYLKDGGKFILPMPRVHVVGV